MKLHSIYYISRDTMITLQFYKHVDCYSLIPQKAMHRAAVQQMRPSLGEEGSHEYVLRETHGEALNQF